MQFIKKTRKKLSELLGYGLSNSETNEVNNILQRPGIQKIRQGTGPNVQGSTLQVVIDYVKNRKKNK